MLGLARIVHECKLTLEVHIDGSRIAIAAREPD
jgi:threonine aldolase